MRRSRGMTLLELILAIVVIGVGLAGVLVAFNQAVLHSADPMVRKQMLAIAEEMMEEITLKPFAATANIAPAGCARNTFNDISDYAGYSSTGVCDIDGNAVASLAGYNVAVAVTSTTLPAPAGVAALRVAVTVSHGADTFTLVGYRTDWAS
ncbi:MAG TPA: prepilin-type N-terminal cleavage/methylation domain-containing protein [Rhodocyclaceae bacterium]|nr:prepilin-type N-terminal cleavage/methylation domain-containing protein [Rhodocyclaceae bacterium]